MNSAIPSTDKSQVYRNNPQSDQIASQATVALQNLTMCLPEPKNSQNADNHGSDKKYGSDKKHGFDNLTIYVGSRSPSCKNPSPDIRTLIRKLRDIRDAYEKQRLKSQGLRNEVPGS